MSRTEIVAAATRLLDRAGAPAVTIRGVAREAEVPTSAIYPHFPCCAALLTAVCEHGFTGLAMRMRTAALSGTQRLHVVCQAYLDFAKTHPRRYRAMFSAPTELAAPVLHIFVDVLTDCAATGHSTSTDPAADAVALWLGLHGLADQLISSRTLPRTSPLAPRLISALAHIH